MGGHPHRQLGKRLKRRKIASVRALPGGFRPPAAARGCRRVARPWPGMCLSTGSTPPASSPAATAPPIAATCLGRVAIGAVADHGIGAARRHVRDRQAIDVDAERQQVAGDQAGAEPGGGEALGHVAVVDPPVGGAARINRPMRMTQPLHPSAFLVDQHRRVGSDRLTAFRGELLDLARRAHIAVEQDEAPRLGLAQETALVGGEGEAREHR